MHASRTSGTGHEPGSADVSAPRGPIGTPWDAELVAAMDAVRATGEAIRRAGTPAGVDRKTDGTVVSDADLLADRLMASALSAAFPADEILSEESDTVYRGGRRVWIVDPLDGSANFVAGLPLWGVSTALIQDGRPVVGVSHYPTLDTTFTAVLGAGAWEQNRRLHSPAHRESGANDLVFHCSRTLARFELDLIERTRVLGCSSLAYAMVASGAARASIEATARIWDLAAGWILVQEAGGAVQPLDPEPVWPLQPGDYAGRGYATLAAVDQRRLDDVRARIAVRGGGRRR